MFDDVIRIVALIMRAIVEKPLSAESNGEIQRERHVQAFNLPGFAMKLVRPSFCNVSRTLMAMGMHSKHGGGPGQSRNHQVGWWGFWPVAACAVPAGDSPPTPAGGAVDHTIAQFSPFGGW
jgi:hypothetical protein